MGTEPRADAVAHEDAVNAVDGLADALARTEDPTDDRRMIFSKGENTRHIRFEQVLNRWPLLPEDWARRVEDTRMASVDRTPGAATFGR
ncbi:MAG: hypothetical protein FJW99_04270 [Actinobacteria bacterium]|nr:hypothetical protein [Actinomycetota bacterium]